MPWYKVYACKEDDATGAVELTREEFKTVNKFFDNIDWFYSEGWHHGEFGIIDEEHNSKDDIVAKCRNNPSYDPDCFVEDPDIVQNQDKSVKIKACYNCKHYKGRLGNTTYCKLDDCCNNFNKWEPEED